MSWPDDEGQRRDRIGRTELLQRLRTHVCVGGLERGDLVTVGPRYGIDPTDPKFLVQVLPDGTRTRGRFVHRNFVACTTCTGGDHG